MADIYTLYFILYTLYQVPAGPIYSVADMVEDPQYLARGMFETVEVPSLGAELKVTKV